MKRKKTFWIAAEWLGDGDRKWWFYAKLLEMNTGDASIALLGNARWYNEKDRKSLLGHILYVFKTFCFALRLCLKARRGDIIFCWNQLPGLIAASFLRIIGSKNIIICQNFLYRDSGKAFGDLVRRSLYNFALGYKYLHLSLQNEQLRDYYIKNCRLNLSPAKIYFISDCLPDDRGPVEGIPKDSRTDGHNYIFTGGEANRDWRLVMNIASRLPELRFCCIARKRFFDGQINIPDNVRMFWDTSLEEYFALLSGCRIAIIPIKDIYNPAGLLLLFDSVLAGKAVVSSDTPFLSPYFGKYKTRLVFDGLNDAVAKLDALYSSNDLSDINLELRKAVEQLSPEAYASQHLQKFYKLSEIN